MCEIYVACLASYNNGRLYGASIDATMDVDNINECIREMLANSPFPNAEEFEIHDSELDCNLIDCYTGIDKAHEIALFLKEHGELGEALINNGEVADVKYARKLIEENYIGMFESSTEFAREYAYENYHQANDILYYIDYAWLWKDLRGDYTWVETDKGIHIFDAA